MRYTRIDVRAAWPIVFVDIIFHGNQIYLLICRLDHYQLNYRPWYILNPNHVIESPTQFPQHVNSPFSYPIVTMLTPPSYPIVTMLTCYLFSYNGDRRGTHPTPCCRRGTVTEGGRCWQWSLHRYREGEREREGVRERERGDKYKYDCVFARWRKQINFWNGNWIFRFVIEFYTWSRGR